MPAARCRSSAIRTRGRRGDPPPAWINEALADLYGFTPGRVVDVPIGRRRARSSSRASGATTRGQQGAIVIDASTLRRADRRRLGDRRRDLARAGRRRSRSCATRIDAAFRAATRLELATPGEIRALSLRIFDRTFAVTYALLAARRRSGSRDCRPSFGALVLARRREFGMLRHLGMTRRQIAAMLATEGARA